MLKNLNDNIFIYLGTGSISAYNNNLDVECHSNTFGNYCNYNTFGSNCTSNTFGGGCDFNKVKNGTNGTSFELYTTGSSMKIQYLTINYISDTIIPSALITLNANYSQVLGLNSAGELVCKPALD